MLDAAILTTASLAALTTLVWVRELFRLHSVGRDFPELSSGDHELTSDDPPTVTVIVSAKDEEEEIEECVRSILSQDYPNLSLVIVDDRSSDRTPKILARLAGEHPAKMRVLTIEELPPGWGGQNHALHRGVSLGTGEWICFTDADCRFDSPDTITVALEEARARGAALLSILPRMDAPTFWERIYLPLAGIVLLVRLRIAEVNDPTCDAGYANGAFLLMRRSAYDALGGHERVRHYVNDDVRLAELAKERGLVVWVTGNADLCHTRMYGTPRGAFSGWSRNFWGTLRSPRRIALALLLVLVLFVLPYAGLTGATILAGALDSGWEVVAFAWSVPVFISHAGLIRLYRAFAISPAWSLLFLPGALFVAAILVRALARALAGRGTRWQGAHYEQPGA